MWHLILLHAITSTTFTVGKAAISYVQPIFFVSIRMLVSGFLLLIYELLFHKRIVIEKKYVSLFIQIIVFLMYFSYVSSFLVLHYVDSSVWALIYTLSPFFVAIFSYYYFGEKLTPKKIFGFLIGLVGIAPTLFFMAGDTEYPVLFFPMFPELVLLFSMIGYSYGWTIFRVLSKNAGYSSVRINGISMFVGGILLLLTSILIDKRPFIMDLGGFFTVIVSIVILNIFAFLVNVYLMRFYTATFLIFLMFVDPLYVSLYGWLFLNETVSWYFFLSVFGVSLGLYIFYREDLRQGYIIK